jgi:hypothetical protein
MPDQGQPAMDFVTIAQFNLPQQAYVARSVLEAQDIPVFLANELTIQVNNAFSPGLGGVELRVPRDAALRGRRLLEEGGLVPELTVPDDPTWLTRFDQRTEKLPWIGRKPLQLRLGLAIGLVAGLVLLLILGFSRAFGPNDSTAQTAAPAYTWTPR